MRSMSAHGDYEDLLHYLECQDASKVKEVFVVHGEYEVQKSFREKLINKGFKNVRIPEMHQKFSIS
jgi:metallo-beta-lactamase family protein